ncbi:hypothetical protein [Aliamphritea hakodatensis]|uniref:hypothetical protein n=1 Tax=Aliamphritea hakodatensis TaxID=2895352 RepID=UPI0022FD5852|nr:hypothetical protein [Aliamphritea hakodatensis]
MPVESVNTTSQWIPLFGPFVGAIIGFSGALAVTAYGKKKEERLARDVRQRNRVERIYILCAEISSQLVEATSDIDELFHQAACEHNGVEFRKQEKSKDNSSRGLPPIKEAEMLIGLYHPELAPEFQQMLKQVRKVHGLLSHLRITSIIDKEEILNEKYEDMSEEKFNTAYASIERFQSLLARHTSP